VNYWTTEFTFTGATGEVALDESQSDQDPRVSTPVEDSGTTGVTTLRFPKGRRWRVVHCSIEEPTAGTSAQMAKLVDLDPDAGTAKFCVYGETFALAHATSGSRGRVTIDIDYQ